jgi:hypothetical protein
VKFAHPRYSRSIFFLSMMGTRTEFTARSQGLS